MNIKRYIGATLALFAFFFFYAWIVHDMLLMGLYEETRAVWRNFDEIEANMPMMMGFQFALAAWTAFAFTQLYKEGGLINGFWFGLYFGVFAGILTATWYLWLPVPFALCWAWFWTSVVQGLGGGLVLGSIYRK